MSIEQDALTLAQWLSPAFPIGAFAYSHGLEAAINSGLIKSGGDLSDWLEDILQHGSGRNDCILLRAAYVCSTPAALSEVNDTGLAFAASAERRLETSVQGAAFCKTSAAVWGGEASGLIYPVAVGASAARLSLNVDLTAVMFVQSMTGNLVSAAQRLMPLGQTDGQAILAALLPLCQEVAAGTKQAGLDDLESTAFLSDIAAMQHETLQPRIFRT
ncbi:urease accessory protein UreF [Neptunicoccus cionae]|uniref:urease accessory protein UreF n=1 Tax=Neptunicoccus cionae TaxID=2035344 RepID=UPI000C757AA7|nr:urease accessory UreF family protein [Amylibacter cionae]PLS20446.1 urease accessory protein UreF [Amylibacter cionae]